MAGRRRCSAGVGIFSTLLALVLAAGCMPTALAETVSMQEERAGTGVVGATVEMAVEVAAEPEVAAQSASVSAPRVRADSSMKSGQVSTWDYVWFGAYPQTEVTESSALASAAWDACGNATVDGVRYKQILRSDSLRPFNNWPDDAGARRYFRYEPVKWRVLRVSGSTALVVTDKAIDCRRYTEKASGVTWATSAIRSWLNGYAASANQSGEDYSSNSFLTTAFSASEREAVQQSALTNADNTRYGTAGGPDTSDRVFLLSEADVWGDAATAHGFAGACDTDDEARSCKPTDLACAMGAYTEIGGDIKGCCSWWLRSPGIAAIAAAYVPGGGWVS